MTQMMIEQLTQEEYSNLLAYGDPVLADTVKPGIFDHADNNLLNIEYGEPVSPCTVSLYKGEHNDEPHGRAIWISTLDSTTRPGMTFGYYVAPCTSTTV